MGQVLAGNVTGAMNGVASHPTKGFSPLANQFQIGDVVMLKSGSRTMTILRIFHANGAQMAHCRWFEGGKHSEGGFPLDKLELCSPAIG
jgi:uncharacterized protein YodC (DUF2158 family)